MTLVATLTLPLQLTEARCGNCGHEDHGSGPCGYQTELTGGAIERLELRWVGLSEPCGCGGAPDEMNAAS